MIPTVTTAVEQAQAMVDAALFQSRNRETYDSN